jgi:hypothetical protein
MRPTGRVLADQAPFVKGYDFNALKKRVCGLSSTSSEFPWPEIEATDRAAVHIGGSIELPHQSE